MNPHPPLSGFPFVILALIALTELLRLFSNREILNSAAKYLAILLVVISPITYYSGYWGVDYANQTFNVAEEFINRHQAFAQGFLLTLVPFAVCSFLHHSNLQSKKLRTLYLASLLVSLGVVAITSFKGGELVFSHGAGVNTEPK